MDPSLPAVLLLSALGGVWLIGWAMTSRLAIKAVKEDDSWLAWNLEDHLPFLVILLFFAWPGVAHKIKETLEG